MHLSGAKSSILFLDKPYRTHVCGVSACGRPVAIDAAGALASEHATEGESEPKSSQFLVVQSRYTLLTKGHSV